MSRGVSYRQPVVGSWIVSWDARGTPFWTNTVTKETTYHLFVPVVSVAPNSPWHVPHAIPPPLKSPKPVASGVKIGHTIRMGKWEENYDAVSGTKTWYNTVTKKTVNKDPYW